MGQGGDVAQDLIEMGKGLTEQDTAKNKQELEREKEKWAKEVEEEKANNSRMLKHLQCDALRSQGNAIKLAQKQTRVQAIKHLTTIAAQLDNKRKSEYIDGPIADLDAWGARKKQKGPGADVSEGSWGSSKEDGGSSGDDSGENGGDDSGEEGDGT